MPSDSSARRAGRSGRTRAALRPHPREGEHPGEAVVTRPLRTCRRAGGKRPPLRGVPADSRARSRRRPTAPRVPRPGSSARRARAGGCRGLRRGSRSGRPPRVPPRARLRPALPRTVGAEHHDESSSAGLCKQLRDAALESRVAALEQGHAVREAAHLLDPLRRPQDRGARVGRRAHEVATMLEPSGSRSWVASSTRSTRGSVRRARATATRFCMPCEKVLMGCDPTCESPTSASAAAARSRARALRRPWSRPKKSRFSGAESRR